MPARHRIEQSRARDEWRLGYFDVIATGHAVFGIFPERTAPVRNIAYCASFKARRRRVARPKDDALLVRKGFVSRRVRCLLVKLANAIDPSSRAEHWIDGDFASHSIKERPSKEAAHRQEQNYHYPRRFVFHDSPALARNLNGL